MEVHRERPVPLEDPRASSYPRLQEQKGWFARFGKASRALIVLGVLCCVLPVLFLVAFMPRDRGVPLTLPRTGLQERAAPASSGLMHEAASSSPAHPEGRTALLSVATFPQGATVYIDADSIGVTPVDSYRIASGAWILTVEMDDYVPFDTVLFVEGDRRLYLPLRAARPPAPVPLTDEAARPPVPPVKKRVRRVSRDVPAEVPAAAPAVRAPEPEAPEAPERAAAPPGPEDAAVLLLSDPPGATVWIDGRRVGATPLSLSGVRPGVRHIRFRKQGYAPYAVERDLVSLGGLQQTLTALGSQSAVADRPEAPASAGSVDTRASGGREDGAVRDSLIALALRTERQYQYYAGQGDALFSQGNYEAAMARYERMLVYKPGDDYALRRFAESNRMLRQARSRQAMLDAVVEDGVYLVSEEPPVLIGGLEKLQEKVRYPKKAYEAGVQGRVYVTFVVDEQGRVRDPKIAEGLGFGCDEEVLRVIGQARLEPGKVGGKPVKVRSTLYLDFRLDR